MPPCSSFWSHRALPTFPAASYIKLSHLHDVSLALLTQLTPAPLTRSLFVPPVAQSTLGVTTETRFLSVTGHAVVTDACTGGESTENCPHLCLNTLNMGIPPQSIVGGLLSWLRLAMFIRGIGNQTVREGRGDIPALTCKERLSMAPMTTATAGSCRRGKQPAGRKLGDLSVLTWSQSMESQTKHGTAESQQGKTEKSAFLFLRWNWRLSRRPGIRVAASWCALKNINLAIGATCHIGWHMTRSFVMLNLETIIGGMRRETAEGQNTGDLPPPYTLWPRKRLETASETQVTKWWGWTFAHPILVSKLCIVSWKMLTSQYLRKVRTVNPAWMSYLFSEVPLIYLGLFVFWCVPWHQRGWVRGYCWKWCSSHLMSLKNATNQTNSPHKTNKKQMLWLHFCFVDWGSRAVSEDGLFKC